MYGGLGISATLPIMHLLFYEYFYKDSKDLYSTAPSIIYYIMMGVSSLGGLFIYTKKYPDIIFPGIYLLY